MIGRGSGGSIVNIASTAGVRAGLGPHVYTAAKHGVVGLTQSVAPELGRHGIRVNAIAPGGTVTSLTAYVTTGDATDLDEAGKRVGKSATIGRPAVPVDIANAALFLASDEAGYVSGAVLVVDAAGEVIGDKNLRFVEMGANIVQEAGRVTGPSTYLNYHSARTTGEGGMSMELEGKVAAVTGGTQGHRAGHRRGVRPRGRQGRHQRAQRGEGPAGAEGDGRRRRGAVRRRRRQGP